MASVADRTFDERKRDGVTDEAIGLMQRVVARVRDLEEEVGRTFADLQRAQDAARDAGMAFQVQMERPVEVAWTVWQERQREQALVEDALDAG